MTKRTIEDRGAAALTRWAALELGGRVHLVGILVGGHDRLPAGAWIITSPVQELDVAKKFAVTASTGRRYALIARLDGSLPGGAQDVIARAMETWRIDEMPPSNALMDAEIIEKLARRTLPERAASSVATSNDQTTGGDPPGGEARDDA
jgi:hypothetical protein